MRRIGFQPFSFVLNGFLLLAVTACGGESSEVTDPPPMNVAVTQSHATTGGLQQATSLYFDADANRDLLVVKGGADGDSLQWIRGSAEAAMSAQAVLPLGFRVAALRPADVNGDNLTDVVMVSQSAVYVSLGTEENTLEPPGEQWALDDGDLGAIDVGHFDDNRASDIAVSGPDGIYILTAGGNGRFEQTDFHSRAADGLRVADLNGDGLVDLLVSEGRRLELLSGLGDGRFEASYTSVTPMGGTDDLHLGDVNNDGSLDILMVSHTGSGGSNLSVLTNDQSGRFQNRLHLHLQDEFNVDMFYTDQAVFFNANCDKRDDLVVLEFSTNQLKLLLSKGDTFEDAVAISEPQVNPMPDLRLFSAANSVDALMLATAFAGAATTELDVYSNPDCAI